MSPWPEPGLRQTFSLQAAAMVGSVWTSMRRVRYPELKDYFAAGGEALIEEMLEMLVLLASLGEIDCLTASTVAPYLPLLS